MCLPHDLIWIKPSKNLFQDAPAWVRTDWDCTLPLVVRRDCCASGIIPAGIRGRQRAQRHPVFVSRGEITRVLRPEEVLLYLERVTFQEHPTIVALKKLRTFSWPFSWGIGGSCGFSLATGQLRMRPESDLDLIIRAQNRLPRSQFDQWETVCQNLGCKADTQIQTPLGGFALKEWLTHERVLLKTNSGPLLVTDPWSGV